MKPSETVITAAFLGYPLESARVEACGRYASVEHDREILKSCRAMSDTFKVWKIFEQATPREVAARVRALN